MFSCLFSDNMAQDSAKIENGCGSSVVEHSLGKGEVESSILSRSTILFFFFCLALLPYKPPIFSLPSLHRLYRILYPLNHACALMSSQSMASMTHLISKKLREQVLKLTRYERIVLTPHCFPLLSFI